MKWLMFVPLLMFRVTVCGLLESFLLRSKNLFLIRTHLRLKKNNRKWCNKTQTHTSTKLRNCRMFFQDLIMIVSLVFLHLLCVVEFIEGDQLQFSLGCFIQRLLLLLSSWEVKYDPFLKHTNKWLDNHFCIMWINILTALSTDLVKLSAVNTVCGVSISWKPTVSL